MGTTRSSNSAGTAVSTTRRASAAGSASAAAASSQRSSDTASKSASAASGGRRSKNMPQPEPEDDDESEDEYEVEYIVAHKKHKTTGKLKFCLKWKGFPDSDNTWEDEENLNCTELVAKYLRERGLDARGNPVKLATPASSSSSAAASSSSSSARKRSAIAASDAHEANPPPTKRSKTAASSKSSAASVKLEAEAYSPGSTPPSSVLAIPSSDGLEPTVRLDPSLPTWDDVLTIDTIGFSNQGTPELITAHNSNNADPGSLFVFGTTHDGIKTCETLADVRLKAPQRLLDFLIQHLKFKS